MEKNLLPYLLYEDICQQLFHENIEIFVNSNAAYESGLVSENSIKRLYCQQYATETVKMSELF